jgi:hypothetical protein
MCRPFCGVRREKAALFQWVQVPPGDGSSRKQPEQLRVRWRLDRLQGDDLATVVAIRVDILGRRLVEKKPCSEPR